VIALSPDEAVERAVADRLGRIFRRRKEPAEFIGLDRFDEFCGKRWDRDGVWLKVLGLGPIDDRFGRVPLIDVQPGDLFYSLAGQHDELHGAWIRRMDGSVGAFELAIEPDELVLVEPTVTLDFGLGRNVGSRIEGNAQPPRRRIPIVVVGFHSPAIRGMNIGPHMVGH